MQYEPPYGSSDPNAPYVNGDPSIAREGSIIPAAAVEYPQREIVNLITSEGLTPTDQDLFQLTRGVRRQFVNFSVDSGAVNTLSIALTPPLEAYTQGVPLRVLVGNDNTGNVTIDVNNLGPRQVVRTNGAQLQPGDLRAGMIAQLVDDGTRYQLTNYLGAVGGTENTYLIHIPYAEDTSTTPSAIIATFVPAITTVSNGDLIEVRVANTLSGATTIAINGLAPTPVRRNDGQPLQALDIQANETVLLEWNYGFWQMLRLVRSQVIFKLTANLTIYVDAANGSDTNDGHDPQHAFKTIMAAIAYVQNSFLIAGRTVTIQLAAGTYVGATIAVANLPGSLVIRGDPSNKLAYVIQGNYQAGAYNNTINARGAGTQLTVMGVTLSPTDPYHHVIECDANAVVNVSDVAFGGVNLSNAQGGAACMATFEGGQLIVSNTIDVYTNVAAMFTMFSGGLNMGLWYTNIIMHGSNMSAAFITAVDAYIYMAYGWLQFGGSAYGPRYNLNMNSVLYTQGAPSTWLPGSQPGYIDASSVTG